MLADKSRRGVSCKEGYGDFCFAPPDLNFYAGVSGRGQESMFQRLNPPPPAVTVGVNRYSQYFLPPPRRRPWIQPRSLPPRRAPPCPPNTHTSSREGSSARHWTKNGPRTPACFRSSKIVLYIGPYHPLQVHVAIFIRDNHGRGVRKSAFR